jgi:pyrimidine-nucleoside phosphorylase
VVENIGLLPQSKLKFDFRPKHISGRWVQNVNAKKVAEACKTMWTGRHQKGDSVNLAIGVVLHVKLGYEITDGEPVATVHADTEEQCRKASVILESAFSFGEQRVEPQKLIKQKID